MLSYLPHPPIKGSPKSYCHLTKVEMVMTKKTLIIPSRILRVWPETVRLSIEPSKKVGSNLSDAQKGDKGRILNCFRYFRNPKIALIISLMLRDLPVAK